MTEPVVPNSMLKVGSGTCQCSEFVVENEVGTYQYSENMVDNVIGTLTYGLPVSILGSLGVPGDS